MGIIQSEKKPVVVCCTSGSALLNLAPAVAEAYYQQLPLIVVSADRSQEWIGQMDGQTIPQPGVFGSMVKKAVSLPEIKDGQDEWFCNRLINEALITSMAGAPGPVQINVPISEPLFDYSVEKLPEVRHVNFAPVHKSVDILPFVDKWNGLSNRMIIVGQKIKSPELVIALENLVKRGDCVVFTEYLANAVSPLFISNFDAWLYAMPEEQKANFVPALVITLGGHIVSKRLKQFLRVNNPENHWHLTQSGEVADLFQSLTDLIETDNLRFINDLSNSVGEDVNKTYYNLWKKASDRVGEPASEIPFSDIYAVGEFLKVLPKGAALHLANSSTVRNAQLYDQDASWEIYCNRGNKRNRKHFAYGSRFRFCL